MEFIKGNEIVKIDPSGVEILGGGHISINSKEITGDISINGNITVLDKFITNSNAEFKGVVTLENLLDINGKTTFTNDTSFNGKTDINNDISINGNIEISGNNNFVITDNNNIGIGLNTPQEKCDISGVLRIGNLYPKVELFTNGERTNNNWGNSTHSNDWKIQCDSELNDATLRSFNIISGYNSVYNTPITILNNGYVGIGTTNPTYPLDVRPNATSTEPTYGISAQFTHWTGSDPEIFTNIPSYDHPYENGLPIGIHSSTYIYGAYGLLHGSDYRIKNEIETVNDGEALKQINQLECKKYHYADPERKRPMKTIGFIAQEVKEVIPNAVSIQTQYIPDELRKITNPEWNFKDNKWNITISELTMDETNTGKAKFYLSNDISGNDEICIETKIKEVETEDSTPLFPRKKFIAEFDQSWNNVFFYGKEVNNFHAIDKAQIFALHHSAIQELSKQNEEKTKKISALENKVNIMAVTNGVLKSSNENLKHRLETLETIVASLQNN